MSILISFDSDALEQYKISGIVTGNNPKEIIQKILTGTDFHVENKYNTWLVVKNTRESKVKSKQITVQGIVIDKNTGERLPYATIYCQNQNMLLSTSVNGTFGFQLPDTAYSDIKVKYLGYYILDTIIDSKHLSNNLSLGLTQKMQNIPAVEVAGEKLEMIAENGEAGQFMFNPARFADLPNYGETDVFRALQLLPGISFTENSSQLNIRGSSSDQNLVLYDGFTLYNLDHFFGVFSALNPNVIKSIQVYRGGFDSRYGERVSGIVDITSKSGNLQNPEFYGGINMISANLATEIPISKKLTLVAAGRRAYTDIYSSWLADALIASKTGQSNRFPGQEANIIEPDFYFGDLNLKLSYTPNQNEELSGSMYGARDYLNSSSFSERPDGSINTEDTNKWGNYGFGFSWKKQWNARSFTILQAGHSGYFNDYYNNTVLTRNSNNEQPVPPQDGSQNLVTNETNDLIDYFVSFQNKYLLNKQHQFESGAAIKFNEFKFYKDADRDVVYNNLENSSVLYSTYFQDRISLGSKWAFKPGIRLNYYNRTGNVYFEPRFAANYKPGNGINFKMAIGRYYQYLNKSASEDSYGYNRDFWVLADGNQHPAISSNHFIAGVNYEIKHLFFDVEAYYKTVDGLQEYLFFQNPNDHPNPGLSQFISGTGQAYGVDILAKYENTNFTSWVAFSLSKATQNFGEINNGKNIPAKYDQPIQLKWTNIYSYRKWNFSSLTLFSTGQPYVESTSRNDDFTTTRVYNRLPDYFRIDLSANYNFNIKNVYLTPGLSILNVLNTPNYLDIYIRNFEFGNTPVNETTLVKAQEITLNFYLNFRF